MIRMPGPVRHPLQRRRPRVITAILVAAALFAWQPWERVVPLTATEARLVGAWGCPSPESPADLGLPIPPLKNPWYVQEFAADRTHRLWMVSGDDPSVRYEILVARWRIDGDTLQTEDIPVGFAWATREAASRIEDSTHLRLAARGIYVPLRVRGRSAVGFRLIGRDSLEFTFGTSPKLRTTRFERLSPDFHRIKKTRLGN